MTILKAVFVTGLLVRLALLATTTSLDTKIVDEQHYRQLARSLIAGDGFAWGPGQPTSIRPPLYPSLLAGAWRFLGSENLQAIRFLQILVAAATAGLVYLLGRASAGPTVGAWAAAVFWLYPSLIFFNVLILTETLFTFLLIAFVLLAVLLVQARPNRQWPLAMGCGLVLGLAALTRSILWPLPILLCPLLAVMLRGSPVRRLALPAVVFAGYALVVTPWAVRNTQLQGTFTVVDTMGGLNLRTGNYEHTPDDRMWDAVSITGEKGWSHGIETDLGNRRLTEGEKDKWAQRKALEYMAAHPAQTARRSLIKFADFWGLEREFIAGVQQGVFPVPMWFAWLVTLAMLVAYGAVATVGAAGAWLRPPSDWRVHVLLLLPILLITGLHTIVFGHSRYHLPLVPILAIYAGAFIAGGGASDRRGFWPRAGAAICVVGLFIIWTRQIVIVDLDRIRGVLGV